MMANLALSVVLKIVVPQETWGVTKNPDTLQFSSVQSLSHV